MNDSSAVLYCNPTKVKRCSTYISIRKILEHKVASRK